MATLDNAVFQESLSFLQKTDNKTGSSLYDHLADVLLKVLEHKPENALNNFENISFEVKHSKSLPPTTVLTTNYAQAATPTDIDNTQNKQIISLFKSSHQSIADNEFPEDDELPNDGEMPDLLEEANILEWVGVGIGKEETYRIMLSMKYLLEKNPLKSVRLFGKILGTKQDYYVCEAQYKDGEGDLDEQDESENANSGKKETSSIPSEEFAGTNKHAYWVCNLAGADWVKLPNVTPAQIVAARKISKFFTGDLEASVVSYPPFPGKEANLLRAQLARITAATSVSPKGFYGFEEEDDVQEDSLNLILPDPEYQPLSLQLLLEPSNWVHHAEHILPQGRCTYFRVRRKNEEGEEEEGGEEEGEDEYDEEEERGPRLLTEITEDKPLGKISSWSTRLSSTHIRKFNYAYVRSNRWPGSYAIAYSNKYTNIYVGFGMKYSIDPFTPSLPPPPQNEPENEPKESIDPTVEEEKELERMLHAEEGDQEDQTEQEGEDMGEEEEDFEDEEYQ